MRTNHSSSTCFGLPSLLQYIIDRLVSGPIGEVLTMLDNFGGGVSTR